MESQPTTPTLEAPMAKIIRVPRPFETKSCGRCGGSGHYSYCQRFGTTCFGCAGKGTVLTKRGAAARAFYQSLLPTKTVADLVPGDKVVLDDYPAATVVEITPANSWSIDPVTKEPLVDPATLRNVVFSKVVYAGVALTKVFRLVPTVAQADAAYAQAVAYQATLTVKGLPAKRAKGAK